jgi:hypothetical protein
MRALRDAQFFQQLLGAPCVTLAFGIAHQLHQAGVHRRLGGMHGSQPHDFAINGVDLGGAAGLEVFPHG